LVYEESGVFIGGMDLFAKIGGEAEEFVGGDFSQFSGGEFGFERVLEFGQAGEVCVLG
jgi:hypothetical protein